MNNKEINEYLPLVSIWSLVYNTGSYVIQVLEAVKHQTYPLNRIQHIVIDDFSTDDSADVVEDWIHRNNYNCIFIRHTENWGICKTLNQVVQLIEGDYCMGNSDDLLHPIAIERFVESFKNVSEKVGLAICNMNIIDGNNNLTSESYFDEETIHFIKKGNGSFFQKVVENYFIPAPAAFYKTNALLDIAPYDESLSYEDYDFNLRFARKYDYIYIDEVNISYRRHTNNFSTNNYLSKESLLLMQRSVLKHINDFPKKSSEQYVIGNFMRKNMERGYRLNYSIFFRFEMYIDFLQKTNDKLFALKIIYKLIVKNTKKTIKKIIKKIVVAR